MIEQIFLLHHTHIDFGYTDDRRTVVQYLIDMVDKVDDLVEKTSKKPIEQQFRWTHENSFPVLEYIRQKKPNSKRLLKHLQDGFTELTALYVNPTDLFEQDSYEISIDYAINFAKENNISIKTAMFGDCPGIAWSVVDMLSQRGVKYLSAAPDFIMSMPLDVERPFWWEGQNGSRLLTWFSDWRNCWYAEGLFKLKLHEEPKDALCRLNEYCQQLEEEGYKWRGLAIHFAMDNQPPREELLEFVNYYNLNCPSRKIRLSTNNDFFSFMETEHGNEFAVHRGAWPDWWANGNCSAAFEVSCSRKAKSILRRCKELSNFGKIKLDNKKIDNIWHNLFMFDEHTWGHQNAVSQPWSIWSRFQWTEKQTFAMSSFALADKLDFEVKQSFICQNQIRIINPYKHRCQGVFSISNDNLERKQALPLVSQDGLIIFGQSVDSGNFDIPRQDIYCVGLDAEQEQCFSYGKPKCDKTVSKHLSLIDLECNKSDSSVLQIYYGSKKKALVDNQIWRFAELIHECIPDGSRELIYDVNIGTTNPQAKRPCPNFTRSIAHIESQNARYDNGDVFESIITKGQLCGISFTRQIRNYHNTQRIDIILDIEKQVNLNYESLYLAFPFKAVQPDVWIEYAGCDYRAGIDQLPGSSTDWHSIGNYLAIDDGEKTIVIVPNDVPVVQIGDINTGKWQSRLSINNGHVYSWIMNNMWFTNFPPMQCGKINLSWSITVYDGKYDREKCNQFAKSVRQGLVICGQLDSNQIPVEWR